MAASQAMRMSDLLVNRSARAMLVQTQIDYFSSNGSETRQSFDMLDITLAATAAEGLESQTRSWSYTGQFGGEAFDRAVLQENAERVAREALDLLRADNCLSGPMDLLLMPDQMMLQIHESIGHPLELDRILGDERNYAGWSFVKPEDFGHLQYGSPLMNVSFDPGRAHELASYDFDDGGNRATREMLIEYGVLKRGLGSLESQARSGLPGVANFRSASWNRAPIDRMANINLEPGTSSLDELIGQVERGVLDANQPLVVDRRLPQQIPVRLRACATDRERCARQGRAQPELPWRHRGFLEPAGRRRSRGRNARHGLLRQGRAEPDHSRRPCFATMPVPRCGSVRRRVMSATVMQEDFIGRVREHFDTLSSYLLAQLKVGEELTINVTAEASLFVRFNCNRVRQNTDVEQIGISLCLQSNGRTVEKSRSLAGKVDVDQSALTRLLLQCRDEIGVLPVDPNQVLIENNGSSSEEFRGALLAAADVVDAVLAPAHGCDLAGLYAGGIIIRGNRNSKGQRHWFATETFFLDYSIYNGPQAAKGCYAGSQWNSAAWAANLSLTRTLLGLLGKPQQDVKPGGYRTYLAPRAFSDLLGMLGWGALSAAAWKQGRSPFKKLAEHEARLSPLLSIAENFALGLTPRFNGLGEVSAARLPLIEKGELQTLLISSRTAKEYGLIANGASGGEGPRAMDVATGSLDEKDVLQALGTGLYLSNLHYLNWSDPVSARVTGMTRYACFWVEGGEIVGPIKDLRWDESLYSALGSKLMALTSHAEIDPAVDTYYRRALGGSRTPGALIEDFSFTPLMCGRP